MPTIARRTGFLFRVLNYLSFIISSNWFVKTHKLEADVIFAYQMAPVFLMDATIRLKKKLKKPLFLYCLDIWPIKMKVLGFNINNFIFNILKKYSSHIYNNADLLAISSLPFKQYLINVDKVKENKIVYLPQHSNKQVIKDIDINKEQVDLLFAGNIGPQQNIEGLLKAVSKIKTDKKYHIHIYGNGTSLNKCKDLAKELNLLDKVTFYGRVDKSYLNNIYPDMDAFLLTLCSEKVIGYTANTVPAKLQDYLSFGKPILASIDGGSKDIILEGQLGLVVPADDIDGYSKILKEFIENPMKYQECGKRSKEYSDKYFDKKIVMDSLEKYLLSLHSSNIEK